MGGCGEETRQIKMKTPRTCEKDHMEGIVFLVEDKGVCMYVEDLGIRLYLLLFIEGFLYMPGAEYHPI